MSKNDGFFTKLMVGTIGAAISIGLYVLFGDKGGSGKEDEVDSDELVEVKEKEEFKEKEDSRRLCPDCPDNQLTHNVCRVCDDPVCKKCAEKNDGLCYNHFNG